MGSKQRPTPVEEAGVASTAIDLVAGLASATVKDDDEAAQEAGVFDYALFISCMSLWVCVIRSVSVAGLPPFPARAHAHALRDIHVVVITECEVKLIHSV